MKPRIPALTPGEAFKLASEVVNDSVDMQLLEAELAKAGPGRRVDVQPRAVLVGLIVSILVQHRADLTWAWSTLCTFTTRQKQSVGFGRVSNSTGKHRDPGYTTFHNALGRLRDHLEISKHVGLPTKVRDANLDRLERLAFDLLASSVKHAPDHGGTFSVDGVVFPANAGLVPKAKLTTQCTTPDAHYFTKKNGKGVTETILGFEFHPLINYTPVGSGMPRLVHGIALTNSGGPRTRGRAAADMVERLVGNGVDVKKFVADRGYSMAKTGDYLDRLFASGVRPFHDLHRDDRGFNGSDTAAGIVWVDGTAFCEGLPRNRAHTDIGPRPGENDPAALARFEAAVANRDPYRARPNTAIDATGRQQFRCGARLGQVRCPLVPESMKLPKSIPTVKNPPAKTNMPRLCKQGSVVANPGGGRGRQPTVWGSKQWSADYSPGRSASERINWDLTRSRNENLAGRNVHQLRGYTSHYLFYLCASIAYNIRTLRTYALSGPVVVTAKTTPKKRTSPRPAGNNSTPRRTRRNADQPKTKTRTRKT